MRIVITGNPGVGKHTCAKLVSNSLGAKVIDINRLVTGDGSILVEKTDKGLDVSISQLRKLLLKRMNEKEKGITMLVGHLAPYALKRADIDTAFVLRRSPYDLVNSLQDRGYSDEKVRENVASEILGVTLYDSIKAFGKGKVIEVDTTDNTAKMTAEQIVTAVIEFQSGTKPSRLKREPLIDWLSLINENGDIEKFFEFYPPTM